MGNALAMQQVLLLLNFLLLVDVVIARLCDQASMLPGSLAVQQFSSERRSSCGSSPAGIIASTPGGIRLFKQTACDLSNTQRLGFTSFRDWATDHPSVSTNISKSRMRGRQSDGSIGRKCFRDEISFLAQQLENGIDAGQSSTARSHGASASAGHSSKFADFDA
jgi:hypothetical protein